MPFTQFTESHAATLQAAFDGPKWRELRDDGSIDAAVQSMRNPPPVENVFSLPVDQLKAINGKRVRDSIAAGERDEKRLLDVLGTWPDEWPADLPVRLSFIGLTLSFHCDMLPRCVYCNQRPVAERLGPEDWKTLLRSLAPETGAGAYVYLTGGEPLEFGEGLWGEDGIIRAAGDAGASCNVNTNALALSPRAALGLVSSGLGRIHISLDTHRPDVGDAIHQCPGRWQQVLSGLLNLQIAKAVLNADSPVIHLNCVLTRLNADDFPAFLGFVTAMKPRLSEGLSSDLDMHLIPVGGDQNAPLRLSTQQYQRFFTDTWDAANAVWLQYQADCAIEPDKRKALHESMPFISPYHRVQQRGDLAAWAECAAAGRPAGLAISKRCYVAPTQAFVLPDGMQYWCGGHAVARPTPVGSILDRTVRANIRHSLAQVADLPADHCRNCPGATQAINQTVESRLRQAITEWLNPEQPAPEASALPEPGVE